MNVESVVWSGHQLSHVAGLTHELREISLSAQANPCGDERTLAEMLIEIERSLAATIRQYGRAIHANDPDAVAIEKNGLACWIRRMITDHFEARLGLTSLDWVWLDAEDECEVTLAGLELTASGRIWCSLPDGRREWTEPFAAVITHASSGQLLADYTLWWGTRETLLNLTAVKRLVRGNELPSSGAKFVRYLQKKQEFFPPAPMSEDGWAYVFHKGELDE